MGINKVDDATIRKKVYLRKFFISLSILLSLFMLTGCTSMDNFSKKIRI